MTKTNPPIANGHVAQIHYTLTNDDGDVLDASAKGDPMTYLHGAGNIPPGLERALEGRTVGDKFEVVIPPEDAYGPKEGPGPQPVPRAQFPKNARIEPGVAFGAEDDEGNPIVLWVAAVEEDTVHVDMNHPLAGMTLHFAVEVVSLRDATEEEVVHGHAHGPHGHHH